MRVLIIIPNTDAKKAHTKIRSITENRDRSKKQRTKKIKSYVKTRQNQNNP